jgi:hypothetical protein
MLQKLKLGVVKTWAQNQKPTRTAAHGNEGPEPAAKLSLGRRSAA